MVEAAAVVPGAGVLPAGTMVAQHYEVVSCIKSGGMGAVYQVLDHRTRRRRALKLMLPAIVPDAEWRKRFKLETTVTSEIDSEHIVETFDAGVDLDSGAPFMVMELLKGEDLGALVKRRGGLPPGEVVELLHQAALALERTHAAGIVHRDLKPENLFVTRRDDGSPRLKILDFGIAKLVSEGAQRAKQTAALGTPLYMAPEQIRGEGTIGPRADLYSMGHIAYTLLAGEAYWLEDARRAPAMYDLLVALMAGASEAPSARAARRGIALPPAFDAWFARATAPAPEQRFASASSQAEALAAALGAAPAADVTQTRSDQVPPPATPHLPRPVPTLGPPPAPHPAARTDAAVSTTRSPGPPRRSSLPLLVVAALVVVLGLGVAALRLAGSGGPPGAAAGANAAVGSTSSAASSAALARSASPASSEAPATAKSAAGRPATSAQPPGTTTPRSAPKGATRPVPHKG